MNVSEQIEALNNISMVDNMTLTTGDIALLTETISEVVNRSNDAVDNEVSVHVREGEGVYLLHLGNTGVFECVDQSVCCVQLYTVCVRVCAACIHACMYAHTNAYILMRECMHVCMRVTVHYCMVAERSCYTFDSCRLP